MAEPRDTPTDDNLRAAIKGEYGIINQNAKI